MDSSTGQKYVVTVDAICGGGLQLSKGETLTEDVFEGYLTDLLNAGAIQAESGGHLSVDPAVGRTSVL